MTNTSDRREKTVLVLQGGGALGAYQGGVYELLARHDLKPEWVAGISIGAINGAIIAGNPPERRLQRLRTFWDMVSSNLTLPPISTDYASRKLFNETSALLVASVGAPGFFSPRLVPPLYAPAGTPAAISMYDTSPLRATLTELVDFDLLNDGPVRLSVGAVQVRTGNMIYFDTRHQRLTPDHIMASGALPPGFPPIVIDGEPYWDGGIVSNTPLQYVMDDNGPREDMCIFQIDLFSAQGPVPQTILDVAEREKEIRYSSRTRLNTDLVKTQQNLRRALRRLEAKIPDELKNSVDWRVLTNSTCDAAITIVHLIHRRAAYSTQSNDYEFSRFTIDEHWAAGRADMTKTLNHTDWISRTRPSEGVMVLDLTRDTAPDGRQSAKHGIHS